MLIDSHCHIDPKVWGDTTHEVIERAWKAGVDRLITIGSGYGYESGVRALEVAAPHPASKVGVSIGLHPHDAKEFTEEGLERLSALAQSPRVLALGELGLDFHYDLSPRDIQYTAFHAQLRLARRLGLPIIIHDRETAGETMRVLDEEKAWELGVLFHCYTGDMTQMEQIIDRGGLISIPGIVTFKNAESVREVARSVPLDRVLVETDSPFLAPVPYRGKRNEPAYVGHVAAAIASLRGMSASEFADIAAQNTLRFFRWA